VLLVALFGPWVSMMDRADAGDPATAPVDADLPQWIKQLGADDARQRDAAQAHLVEMGAPATAALKSAASDDPDPEVRSRAAAALKQLGDRQGFEATLITLHLKDVPVTQALSALETLANVRFNTRIGASSRQVTIDADRKPLWNVLIDLCLQADMRPWVTGIGTTINLDSCAHDQFLAANYQAVGAFLVAVESVNLDKTVNLIAPATNGNRLSARLAIYPEPKLSVGNNFNFTVEAASDDLGNSLMRNPLDPLNLLAGPDFSMLSNAVEVRLLYPDHPGRRIALLRGHLTVMLAKDYQECVFDDVLGTPKIQHRIDGCNATLTVSLPNALHPNGLNPIPPSTYRISLTFSRDGASDDLWNAMTSCKSKLTMLDATGQPLGEIPIGYQQPRTFGQGSATFILTHTFSSAAVPAMGNQPARPKTGDPVKLIWRVPTSSKALNLPLSFKDLPIP
jgi:hypothetical protein